MFKYSHCVCSDNDCGEVFKDVEVCTKCREKTEELKVIASWGICNTASLNVFKINEGIVTTMLVAINNIKPQWCSVEEFVDHDFCGLDYCEKDNCDMSYCEGNNRSGIKYVSSIYYLDECIKV